MTQPNIDPEKERLLAEAKAIIENPHLEKVQQLLNECTEGEKTCVAKIVESLKLCGKLLDGLALFWESWNAYREIKGDLTATYIALMFEGMAKKKQKGGQS